MLCHSISTLALLAAVPMVLTGTVYNLVDDITGNNFLSAFEHQDFPDPTHGRVQYVDQPTATQNNLTFVSQNTIIMRADSTKTLDPSGPGRMSIRVQSLKQYTTHVAVFDVRHIPEGCSTWPSIWEIGDNWPTNGETDIMEGVNNAGVNAATLHTAPNCSVSQQDTTGTLLRQNCDVNVDENAGCSTSLVSDPTSFGPSFNQAGGGWYVMERTATDIKIWFFAGNETSAPVSVTSGAQTIDTSTFPKPGAHFSSSNTCDFNSHFGPHNIVINLSLCGGFAGNTFQANGCGAGPQACVDLVNNSPAQFANAFFDIAGIRVYEYAPGAAPPPVSASAPASASSASVATTSTSAVAIVPSSAPSAAASASVVARDSSERVEAGSHEDEDDDTDEDDEDEEEECADSED